MKTNTIYTKEFIQEKLSTDISWITRGLVVLYQHQTESEKYTKETNVLNYVGFNGSDSRYLSYCSEWVLRGGTLSGKHLEKVSRKLPKYWKQIQNIILSKQH